MAPDARSQTLKDIVSRNQNECFKGFSHWYVTTNFIISDTSALFADTEHTPALYRVDYLV